jgi:Hsp70 protein
VRAIDFGTSSTAAAHRGPGGGPELVTFGGAYAFPSTAAIDHGELICGEEAENLLPGDPSAGTRAPKLILANDPHAPCPLGGEVVEVVEVVAGILREANAGDHRSPEGPRTLTHPADWEPEAPRWTVLVDAAERAGLGRVDLISEPIAVAWHLAEQIEPGTQLCVFDLGGGTCDMAALERTDVFELIARPHSEPIGGELMDHLLVELVLERLTDERPDEASALRAAARMRNEGVAPKSMDLDELGRWQRCFLDTERAVRTAKVRLSREEEAVVRIPGPANARLTIGRSELAGRVRPSIERAVDALSTVMAEAGLEPEETTVLLSGAASVMPVVREVLAERTGARIEPVSPAKGAVVLGALRALRSPKAKAARRASDVGGIRLELGPPVEMPWSSRVACLTPSGDIVVGGTDRLGVIPFAGSARRGWGSIEWKDSASVLGEYEVTVSALAPAPDGRVAVATSEGKLYTTTPGKFAEGTVAWERTVLIKEKFLGPRLWLMSALEYHPTRGKWIVARRNGTVVFIDPNGEESALEPSRAAKITDVPFRVAPLPRSTGLAVLMDRRLVIFDEADAVIEAGDSSFCDMSVGPDGVLAAAHADGTIDLIAAGVPGHDVGNVLETLTTFTVADEGDEGDEEDAALPLPKVAMSADHLLVAVHERSGVRVVVFDRLGRVLAQAEIEGAEKSFWLFLHEPTGVGWIAAGGEGGGVFRIPVWALRPKTQRASSAPLTLELVDSVPLPFETRAAALTPAGELAIGGYGKVAVISDKGIRWWHALPPSADEDAALVYALACAPDGTLGVTTSDGNLHSFALHGGLIETLAIGEGEALEYNPAQGAWMVAGSDGSVRLVRPGGTMTHLHADAAGHLGDALRLRFLPPGGCAVLRERGLVLVAGDDVVVLEDEGESEFCDIAAGPDGILAVAHSTGSIDLVATRAEGSEVGSVRNRFCLPILEPSGVALGANRLLAASWSAGSTWTLDLEGRVLGELDLPTLRGLDYVVLRAESGVGWVGDEALAHLVRIPVE